ncbi:hypothetical protein GCM10029976_093440 [Kribbella albertanoniae]|uniref:Uncharacterized protein n=1 Tax=Kribbella albertanoniae TaxID=1266829 RepID=A0A4R4NXP9_9ACTN|nr:hypothetical protein [Kribbella albertanoniae]TDC14651.1 hypothetical protein E1261_41905 [Kribbella albertanoniae]
MGSDRLARDAAVVIVDGDEVPGLSFYGLVGRGCLGTFVLPAGEWPGDPEARFYLLHGVAWEVANWDLPVVVWSTGGRFRDAIRQTLAAVIAAGCRVAWVAAEGFPFCDPPALFDPECMSGGVLAWMTAEGDFACPLDPDAPLPPVNDEQLMMLRQYSLGLADAD